TQVIHATTVLDALGRPSAKWHDLGADYSSIIVDGVVRYDQAGRVVFAASPFSTAPGAQPGVDANIAGTYGTSVVYDAGGRVLRSVEGKGLQDVVTATSKSVDTFVTSTAYSWANGVGYVSTWDPDDNDPASPRHGKSPASMVGATALGRVISQGRY